MRTRHLLIVPTFLIPFYSALLSTDAFVIQRPVGPMARSSSSPSSLSLSSPFSSQLHLASSSVEQSDPDQTLDDEDAANTTADEGVSWNWEAVATAVFEEDKRPIILFDGHCNLCNGGVNFAIDYDPNAKFRFASLHTKVGKSLLIRSGREPDDLSSIVVCLPDGKAYVDSEAVLMIAQGLVTPISVVGTVGRVIPAPLRDAIYEYVSRNRYKFAGEYDSCRLDFDGEYDDRFVSDPDL